MGGGPSAPLTSGRASPDLSSRSSDKVTSSEPGAPRAPLQRECRAGSWEAHESERLCLAAHKPFDPLTCSSPALRR